MSRLLTAAILFFNFQSISQDISESFSVLESKLTEYSEFYEEQNKEEIEFLDHFVEDFISEAPDSAQAEVALTQLMAYITMNSGAGFMKVDNLTLARVCKKEIKKTFRGTSLHKKINKGLIKKIRNNSELIDLYSGFIFNNETKELTPDFKEELKIYNFKNGDKIADVGCGLGTQGFAISLLPLDLELHLNEVSKILQPYLKKKFQNLPEDFKRKNVVLVKGKKKDAKLNQNYFDKIIMRNALHHFEEENKMLLSIKSSLKETGVLYIYEDLKEDNEVHACPIIVSEKIVSHAITHSGFEIQKIHKVGLSTIFECKKE